MIKNTILDSGYDLAIMGYRCVVDGKLGEEVWFDESPTSKDRVGIAPNETILLLTGIQLELPNPVVVTNEDGHVVGFDAVEAQIRGRSGLSLKSDTNVKLGTIDNPYRGDCGIIFHNEGIKVKMLDKGDKIAQLVFNPIYIPSEDGIEFVDELGDSKRGATGFGNSGVKS